MLLAVAEHKGIRNELIPRIATGFCSGTSRTGGVCGAVSGGIMAIGLCMGRSSPNDHLEPCYEAVRKFLERFTAQYNSLNCMDLSGVHLGTDEGQAAFKENRRIVDCTNYVGEAARIAVELVDAAGSVANER